MKITFEDKSYIEVRKKPDDPNQVIMIISAKDQSNPLKKISNAVEITLDEFKALVKEILG